ncbi:hypothetical protein [Nostoc sp.]
MALATFPHLYHLYKTVNVRQVQKRSLPTTPSGEGIAITESTSAIAVPKNFQVSCYCSWFVTDNFIATVKA